MHDFTDKERSLFFFLIFIYLFLAALGLHCCTRAFSSCGKQGLLFTVVCGLLVAVASLSRCARFSSCGMRASVVVSHGLSCSTACGIFSDQGSNPGSNPCPLHWQADSLFIFLIVIYLFVYLFLAVLGLRFCARAFSSCGERGPLFIAVRGPLTIAASLVAEHRLQTRRLSNCGSRA